MWGHHWHEDGWTQGTSRLDHDDANTAAATAAATAAVNGSSGGNTTHCECRSKNDNNNDDNDANAMLVVLTGEMQIESAWQHRKQQFHDLIPKLPVFSQTWCWPNESLLPRKHHQKHPLYQQEDAYS